MKRDGWQGSSLWQGATVTLVIHLLFAIMLVRWQLPPVPEPVRVVSVLLGAAEPAPTPPAPPKKPPSPRSPTSAAPPAAAPGLTEGWSLPVAAEPLLRLPDLSLPSTAAALPALVLAEPPRPQTGIEASSLPTRIQLRYTVRSSLVDGRAEYDFQRRDQRYSISGYLEADGFFAQMFAGRFEQASEGTIGTAGLQPSRFSLKRGDAQAEVATFDRVQGRVVHQRLRSEHVQPLESGSQDLQSFIFQFGPEFTRNPQLSRVRFAISNARKMDAYEFEVRGRETIRTVLGDLDTLHLVRRADDPADAYEAWLSPSHHYLPVRLRYRLAGRVQVEQDLAALSLEP